MVVHGWCVLAVLPLVVVVSSALVEGESCILNGTFHPEVLDVVAMGSRQTIAFNLSVDCDVPLHLFAFSRSTLLARVENSRPSMTLSRNPTAGECFSTGNVSVELKLIGKTFVDLYAVCGQEELVNRTTAGGAVEVDLGQIRVVFNASLRQLNHSFELKIIRIESYLDDVFVAALYVSSILTTIGMGMKTDLKVVKSELKRPIAPIVGSACQCVVMPLIAFSLAKASGLSNNLGFALFVSGCCPAGSFSNFWTYLFKGDVTLSVTMTLISTVACLGLFPFWVATLGQVFIDDTFSIHIPFLRIFLTIVSLVIPIGVGLAAIRFLPRASKCYLKIMTPLLVLLLLIYLVAGLFINYVLFSLATAQILIGSFLLPFLGFLLGGIIARICCQPKKRIVTIAIETGVQNYTIAILVLKFSLPPPEGDISMMSPLAAYLATPVPLFILLAIFTIYWKCAKKETKHSATRSDEEEEENEENENQVEKTTMLQEIQLEESTLSSS